MKDITDKVQQRSLDLASAQEVFRPALVVELRERPYEFDMQVQLCTDLEQMPVEDVTSAIRSSVPRIRASTSCSRRSRTARLPGPFCRL
ncbi:hypothetical protein AB4039_07295 [Streptomyces sp. M-16]|uniref:hypothetical protein n=1 Tax=Streptomyces sp. M-16 TaxID=3233040 RepID=UPI003F967A0D